MRVVVLGGGVIGVTSAWYLAEAGHEVVVLDRQSGPAWRPASPMPARSRPATPSPWAAPGLPIKALQWLFMRHRPLVIWPMPDPAMIAWGLRLLLNCTSARYELNKSRMVPIAEYSRDLLRELSGEARPRLRRAGAGHAAAVPQAEAARRHRQGHRGAQALRRRLGAARRRRLHRGRAGAGAGAREVRRRPAPARRRDRRLLQVHRRPGRRLPPAGRRVPLRHGRSAGIETERGRVTGIATGNGQGHGRRLRRGARQLVAAAAAPARRAGAGLPGQGLLAHRADHRSGRRAGIHGHGRDPQGGDHAAGRPHPGRRHGRAGRLQHQVCARPAAARSSMS